MSERRHFTNLFPIVNAKKLTCDYRLVRVCGLEDDDTREKNLNVLVGRLATTLQQPVALVTHGGSPHIAMPFDVVGLTTRHQLAPFVVDLKPEPDRLQLDFGRLVPETQPIAVAFLNYALRKPLMKNRQLWRYMGGYYRTEPLPTSHHAEADLYSGFGWRIVILESGDVCIALDVATRYLDRRWLHERCRDDNRHLYLHRHAIYHGARGRFAIQIAAICDEGISKKTFSLDGKVFDVHGYTKQKAGRNPPEWIAELDPQSSAIMYTYPNRREKYAGALALCKLTLKTNDASVRDIHRRSALPPQQRADEAARALSFFDRARFGDQLIELSREPISGRRNIFPVPPLVFGNNRVLEETDLRHYARSRMELLESPAAGPLDTAPFMQQYLIQPLSVDRHINDDFHRQIEQAVRRVSQNSHYTMKRILFDDRRASSLPQQVKAIREALERGGEAHGGYALLVLPENAREGLHSYVKRALLPNVHVQCATAAMIRSFYRTDPSSRRTTVPADRRSKYDGALRNLACAMLILNRKWPWAVSNGLGADVYVGIDVLHGVAGFTFIYAGGRHIIFREAKGLLPEKLSSRQVRQVLVDFLREDISRFGIIARRITIHRDGQIFDSELRGIGDAMRQLSKGGVLPLDAEYTVAAIHKTSSTRLRLIEGIHPTSVENPTAGSWFVLNQREGVVCCTGWPFKLPGTAQPLLTQIVEGNQPIEVVLSDIYSLAQLAYASPTMCMRVPLTIKLTDDFLEPIAARVDVDEMSYDDHEESDASDFGSVASGAGA